MTSTTRALMTFSTAVLLVIGTACVQRDPRTGRTLPAGDQRYTYQDVKGRASELVPGMSRRDVLVLLGSPAHRAGDDWVYLPERSGLLLPADAMRVRFQRGRYTEHQFEPIILGERLPLN